MSKKPHEKTDIFVEGAIDKTKQQSKAKVKAKKPTQNGWPSGAKPVPNFSVSNRAVKST